MTNPLAFKATYSDWKLIRTRGVVQIVMEVPLADSDAAYDVLGGMPDPARENWFAVAPLKIPQAEKETEEPETVSPSPRRLDKPAGAKRDWDTFEPAQQAGMRSNDKRFAEFLQEEYPQVWREHQNSKDCIKDICVCTHSRAELGADPRKRVLWNQLDRHFDAWLIKERVGA